jgi:hypothetical protein
MMGRGRVSMVRSFSSTPVPPPVLSTVFGAATAVLPPAFHSSRLARQLPVDDFTREDDPSGVHVVPGTRTIRLRSSLALELGGVLPELEVNFAMWSPPTTMNAPVVLICPSMSHSAVRVDATLFHVSYVHFVTSRRRRYYYYCFCCCFCHRLLTHAVCELDSALCARSFTSL